MGRRRRGRERPGPRAWGPQWTPTDPPPPPPQSSQAYIGRSVSLVLYSRPFKGSSTTHSSETKILIIFSQKNNAAVFRFLSSFYAQFDIYLSRRENPAASAPNFLNEKRGPLIKNRTSKPATNHMNETPLRFCNPIHLFYIIKRLDPDSFMVSVEGA